MIVKMATSKMLLSAFGGICFIFILNALSFQIVDGTARSFTIDYDKNTFLKDGEPFFYVSGSIHYARIPHQYWKDRLTKMYAAGLDAVQFYIPWNVHEPTPGEYKFDGQEDLEGLLVLAQEIGLLVIIRAGPYICGEWEYGGFPPWILKENGSIVVRTMNPGYIKPVDNWLSVLLPKISKHTYANGGPVIMVQAENEYGSYFACDRDYMEYLKNTFRKYLGNDIILFTTDGAGDNFLVCGTHEGLFVTVDFGPGNATENFKPLIKKQPKGPRVNSEFYTGWLDYWGGGHAHGDTKAITDTLKQMIEMKASSNM